MQSIFNISQAEVENLLKDHETEEVSIQVQMSKSENLPSTVTEEPSQFDSQFGESQLGDTSGTFPYIQNQIIFFGCIDVGGGCFKSPTSLSPIFL